MRELLTIGRYFQSKFGQRVRKIPVSLEGFTCPNIDGSITSGGCIYCKNESFSPSFVKIKHLTPNIAMNFSLNKNPILHTQLAQLEEQFYWHAQFNNNKFAVKKYMIYFQSYTNTYAPLETLKALWDKSLSFLDVVGMSIGTRIDCISDVMLDMLQEYVQNGKEIWLEYGIQSVFNKTLKAINRGHTINGAQELFERTRKKGIKVCAHLIYGLPNESADMMLRSLRCVLKWGIDGIKIHPLYIVEGTQLAKIYNAGRYEPIDLDSYINLIIESIQLIPQDVVIHRISSGAHHESLIAPKWCFDKNIQMRILRERLLELGIVY